MPPGQKDERAVFEVLAHDDFTSDEEEGRGECAAAPTSSRTREKAKARPARRTEVMDAAVGGVETRGSTCCPGCS